jgi:hypothetical protein
MNDSTPRYTCQDYRKEMQLLALQRRLEEAGLSEKERLALKAEIRRLEAEMDMD